MGVRPFYYFASDDVFVCATSLAAMFHLECVPIHIEPQWGILHFPVDTF